MPDDNYANPAALVSTEWVAEHGNDPNVRLLEVDVDTSAYAQGHIAGRGGRQLDHPARRSRSVATSRPEEDWEALLGAAGATSSTKLVFYGDNNNWFAAFAYWVAKIYGHQDAALMNGGRKKWELENRPLTTDAPSITPAQYTASEPNFGLRAYLKDVLDYAQGGRRQRADRRALAGRVQGRGHRPARHDRDGAARRPHPGRAEHPLGPGGERGRHLQDRADELKALYSAKGVTADKRRHRLLPHRRALVATPGSCSRSCSACPTCATTTAPGPSTAPSSACRSTTRRAEGLSQKA